MKKSIIISFTFIIITLFGFYYFSQERTKNQEKNALSIGKVKKTDIVQRVTIAGNVSPLRMSVVTAPFNGYVKKLYVKIGDQVKKGDPIVSIAQSLQSSDPLFPLRSPLDGTVVTIQKQEGEFVKQDDVKDFVLRIDSLNELYINSNVPEIDMVKIKIGQEAIIKASAILGKKYKGKVVSISLASKTQEGFSSQSKVEFPAKIKILNPDDKIKSGMSTILDIVTFKKDQVLALKHEFIVKEKNQYYVYLENGNRKKITVGIQNESVFEIVDGLSEGDKVKQVDFIELLKNAKSK